MKTCVYTANIGGYDTLLSPKIVEEGVDYICLTDTTDHDKFPSPWKARLAFGLKGEDRERAKQSKLMPLDYVGDYDRSLWIDANLQLKVKPSTVFGVIPAKKQMAMLRHPVHDCVYEEMAACAELGGHYSDRLDKAMGLLAEEEFPRKWGLKQGGFIARQHTEDVEVFCKVWFDICKKVTWRDQIVFPYLLRSIMPEFGLNRLFTFTNPGSDFFRRKDHKDG